MPDLIRRLAGLPAKTPSEPPPMAAGGPIPSGSPTIVGGFQQTPHSRRAPLGWRIAAGFAIALVVITGLWHLIGAPVARAIAGPAPTPPRVETIDGAVAASLAAGFTGDYWSFDSANPDVRADALAGWTGSHVTFEGIAGRGQLRTDLVTAGPVVTSGSDVAVVQTRARVTPAQLRDGAAEPGETTRPQDAPRRAADPGPLDTDTWQPGPPVWLTLDVVVTRTDDGLAVTGATLSGDAPAAIAPTTTEVDAPLTGQTSTAGLPDDVFEAYAAGDGGQLSYLTTPDVHLAGLDGAVEPVDVTGWSMATDRADNGDRYTTADVIWQLTGTDLQVPQSYALSLTETDGRWLIGSIGPRIEE